MQNLLAVFSLHCLGNFATNIPCKQRGIKSLSPHNRCTQQKHHEGHEIAQKTKSTTKKAKYSAKRVISYKGGNSVTMIKRGQA